MEVTSLEDQDEIETINPKRWTSKQGAAAVVAAEEEPYTVKYLNDCNRLAKSRWEDAGLAGFRSFLGELLELQLPCFPSLSSSKIPSR
jgi:hypothetical protein